MYSLPVSFSVSNYIEKLAGYEAILYTRTYNTGYYVTYH